MGSVERGIRPTLLALYKPAGPPPTMTKSYAGSAPSGIVRIGKEVIGRVKLGARRATSRNGIIADPDGFIKPHRRERKIDKGIRCGSPH